MVKVNSSNAPGIIVKMARASTSALVTCSTASNFDDTIPQNTEGDEVLTVSITPKKASHNLHIIFTCNAGARGSMALFQDATTNALAASNTWNTGTVNLLHTMTAGTTSSTTFKMRVGQLGTTVNVNGLGGGRKFGGVSLTTLTVIEYEA